MRKRIPINFAWHVKTYDDQDLIDFDVLACKKVDIPHQPIKLHNNYFSLKEIEQKYSYYYEIQNVDFNRYDHAFLIFEGVAIECDIYINNKHVGHNQNGYTPYKIDIKAHINPTLEKQTVLVIVSGIEKKDLPPFGGVVDYLGYVGIYREVYLDLVNVNHLKDVFMYQENPLASNILNIEVETTHQKGVLSVEVIDIEKNVVAKQSFLINDFKSLLEVEVKHKKLWSLENPYLYDVEITYHNEKEQFDVYQHKFGFRKLEFRDDGFYINGQFKKLMGINRHQSYPYQGYAMPKGAQREDADILKRKLGIDIVRSSHYPCSPHFLDRCDEIGLLVLEEIPGWQYIGDESFKNISYESLKQMILRDKNHASICLWGVRINESADDHDFYTMTNDIARSLDFTRQTCGIRNMDHSEFLEDVYTYNDFSHTGNNKGIKAKKDIVKQNVPYLITEHNGHMFPVKPFDSEAIRLDQAKRHLRVIDDVMDLKNNISGAIGWVMSDYQTHPSFGSVDGICYHGVLDIYRMPKIASYGYLSQTDKSFILETSSSFNIGEHPGGLLEEVYVFTNLDYIKLFKNDAYVKTFYPHQKRYPHLKHPPIIIDDFIGSTIEKQENMSKKDAESVKNIINYVVKHGNHLLLKHKLKMAFLLKKYKMTFDDGIKLFYKYTSGWGEQHSIYRIEGYKDDVKVKEIIKTHDESFILNVTSAKSMISHEDTYDTIRYEVSCIDQYKNIKSYLFEPCFIEVKGDIELIGENVQSLQSGQLAFWVKSIKPGIGKIKISVRDQIVEKEVLIK